MFFEDPHTIFAKNLVITKQMGNFKKVKYESVRNEGGYVFYKLHQGNSCQFDDFRKDVQKSPLHRKAFSTIFSWMQRFGTTTGVPVQKFKMIKGLGRKDVYEFKCKDLRVYVKVVSPDVVIILGGYKKNQKLDIERLKYKLPSIDLL